LREEGKDIFILGGPNGAGKTTAARILLPDWLPVDAFLNADEIARRISPGNAEAAALTAGRLMLRQMRDFVRQGASFAFETTCAARSYARFLQDCQEAGWRISLIYLWLPSPEYSVARVARRVSQGGHSIPQEVIYRRYRVGLWNMRTLYLPLADSAMIYDNSDGGLKLIARRTAPNLLRIVNKAVWSKIEEETKCEP
jgi:predicted ABC-type ATPase